MRGFVDRLLRRAPARRPRPVLELVERESGPRKAWVLGGRRFVEVEQPTVACYLHAAALVSKAGVRQFTVLEKLVNGILKPEDPEETARRLLETFLASGLALKLIASGLVPEGTDSRDWTPALAEEIEAFIGGLNAESDVRAVNDIAARILSDFIRSGIVCSTSTQTSSRGRTAPEERRRAGASATD